MRHFTLYQKTFLVPPFHIDNDQAIDQFGAESQPSDRMPNGNTGRKIRNVKAIGQ